RGGGPNVRPFPVPSPARWRAGGASSPPPPAEGPWATVALTTMVAGALSLALGEGEAMSPGQHPKVLTDDQLARYRAGQVAVTDLAAETGWGYGTVRRALLRQGVTLRRERVGRPVA